MKRFGGIFCVVLIMVTLLSGCSEPSGLDPKHPVTLTLWHNFGGQMQTTMDALVDEFNGTVGKENGVILSVTSISGSASVQEKLTMIADGDPGAPEMPDIATCYPATAALLQERELLAPVREHADVVLDTTAFSTAKLRSQLLSLFGGDGTQQPLNVSVLSFGYKNGLPLEADLVLDVRCLPNPFYVPELKHKTGLDQEVVDFVMSHPEAQELLHRYENFLQYALPLYVKEGKSQLTIAVGCTGGQHLFHNS